MERIEFILQILQQKNLMYKEEVKNLKIIYKDIKEILLSKPSPI